MQIVYTDASGQATSITPDACVEEAHGGEADVTEEPVDTGAPISDHVRAKQRTIALEIFVSNSPIVQPPDQMQGVTSSMQPVSLTGVQQKATLLTFSGNVDRVGVVFDELHRIKDEGVLVSVVTSLKTYDNCVLWKVDAKRNATFGNTLNASLIFKQIRIVQTQTAPAPSIPRARTRSARGTQATTPQTAQPQSQANASFWSRVSGSGISVPAS